jgi:hypothetical protein
MALSGCTVRTTRVAPSTGRPAPESAPGGVASRFAGHALCLQCLGGLFAVPWRTCATGVGPGTGWRFCAHDRLCRAGQAWTARYERWRAGLRFDDAALHATYIYYRPPRGVGRDAELAAIEAALASWCELGGVGRHDARRYRGAPPIWAWVGQTVGRSAAPPAR